MISAAKFHQLHKLITQTTGEILVIGHQKPDGDALGSVLAMANYLTAQAKKFHCYTGLPLDNKYRFLVGFDQIKTNWNFDFNQIDLVIVLDSGSLVYAGVAELLPKEKTYQLVNFDHHATNTLFGDLNIVEANTSSTSEMIFSFFKTIGFAVDANVATSLLAGIVFDTSFLTHSATKTTTLEVFSELIAVGGRIEEVYIYMKNNKPLSVWQTWGEGFERLIWNHRYRAAITYFQAIGDNDVKTEDFTNFLNQLEQAKLILVLEEAKGFVKGRFRTVTAEVNAAQLATWLGGGGHRKAAGFQIKGKLEAGSGGLKVIVESLSKE